MATRSTSPTIRLISAERGEPRVISNGVLGMSLFVLTEIMLFAGMISVFNIVRAQAIVWPPPNQPRLSPGSRRYQESMTWTALNCVSDPAWGVSPAQGRSASPTRRV